MSNYYNENDPKAAAWLRELIKRGLIPPGDVDERSIEDVKASDLEGYIQCHWFAGIGGWPLALRIAGVSPDISLWTGSAPCQPLSCAGKREGEMDERHLWPVWYSLIAECRPDTIYGEQTASGDGPEWLDGISLDLEELGYAVGTGDLPAACVGAPNIRQRLWWVGHADDGREGALEGIPTGPGAQRAGSSRLADAGGNERRARGDDRTHGWPAEKPARLRASGGMADAAVRGKRALGGEPIAGPGPQEPDRGSSLPSFWTASDLLPCRDGKARRVESGTFPLAYGVPGRVGLLRGYGNAINPWVAAKFIRAHVEARDALASAGHRGNRP